MIRMSTSITKTTKLGSRWMYEDDYDEDYDSGPAWLKITIGEDFELQIDKEEIERFKKIISNPLKENLK